ncbi:hypothetical protein CERSUDRAFT_128053 [Gelatoporia subvermispora B]|uniref:G domain-containing protein n=1 Tax=Ceriporiopsis subvermispora (strain B) TaxID=914234 RepID=M2PWY8_CERS8|nr:hypothetical protein CERSUDRAFT_128053 [Gelatoporia subvermispora B]
MKRNITYDTVVDKGGMQEELRVAVMGASGTGKSTFINLLSKSNFRTSNGLDSCTESIELSEPFLVEGRTVRLIDTPGFDDSSKTDVDILDLIANFLASQYRDGYRLSGVIYMQRISDPRVGGLARRNFVMFTKLCGLQFMKNVVFTTTRWNEVESPVAHAREEELKSSTTFLKPALESGACYMRHDKGIDSARCIVRHLVQMPVPGGLDIQLEMVDQGKDVSETTAGQELRKEVAAQMEKQVEEMRELKEQMKQALEEHDEDAEQDLRDEILAQHALLDRLKSQVKHLSMRRSAGWSTDPDMETGLLGRNSDAPIDTQPVHPSLGSLLKSPTTTATSSKLQFSAHVMAPHDMVPRGVASLSADNSQDGLENRSFVTHYATQRSSTPGATQSPHHGGDDRHDIAKVPGGILSLENHPKTSAPQNRFELAQQATHEQHHLEQSASPTTNNSHSPSIFASSSATKSLQEEIDEQIRLLKMFQEDLERVLLEIERSNQRKG